MIVSMVIMSAISMLLIIVLVNRTEEVDRLDNRIDALTHQNKRLRDERDQYRGMLDIPTVVRKDMEGLVNDFVAKEFLGKPQ